MKIKKIKQTPLLSYLCNRQKEKEKSNNLFCLIFEMNYKQQPSFCLILSNLCNL